jgi:hypothetical protein
MQSVGKQSYGQKSTPENLEDRAFNFRMRGLNADFMSYSTLHLGGNDKRALLDPTAHSEYVSKVFGTFFKHYVFQNITFASGGPAYQPIGATLPADLGSLVPLNTTEQANYGKTAGITARTVSGTLYTPVEQLVMYPAAVWLSVAILIFLCFVIVFIYTVYRNRFKALPRDVDSLASVLGLVHGSEKLLEWVREHASASTWNQVTISKGWFRRQERGDANELKVMMGPFDRADGRRWGVEIVD